MESHVRRGRVSLAAVALAAVAATSSAARADGTSGASSTDENGQQRGASSTARAAVEATSEPPKKQDEDDPDKTFHVGGYVETFYAWDFQRPSNGIVEGRGYDNRHDTFALQNAVLDTGFRAHHLMARLALQTGTAPATYYAPEPALPGTENTGESTPELWRHLQRASVGWEATRDLLLEAGLFLTSFGLESVAVKDDWNWSRSNLSVHLPTYVTGLKSTLHASKRVDLVSGIVNGWNRVVDDNDEKTLFMSLVYKAEKSFTASASYYGGVEREGGAPEGRAWRHATQAFAQADVTDWLSLAADGAAGLERTRFGAQRWAGVAGLGRVKAAEWLYFAARVDGLWEEPATNALGASRPILIDAGQVVSATGTIDVHPVKGLSTRLELRHDAADGEVYYAGDVAGDGTPANPFVPNAKQQTTLLLGVVAWF